jgi:hypothetical protein
VSVGRHYRVHPRRDLAVVGVLLDAVGAQAEIDREAVGHAPLVL